MRPPFRTWSLARNDAAYPECLLLSPEPPETLYGCGSPGAVRLGLAIIGARRATPYGLSCARLFAGWAAERGVTIVSGAARGCDMAAHQAALEAGGSTVAVLGCGADVDYPPQARALLAELRRDHAVVAEAPWGSPPAPFAFSRRNRIIAALSAAVLVVEAALPSGTFSTAGHAADAGREVFAVPGSVFSDTSRGCNRLIRDGGHPVSDVSDLAGLLVQCGLLDDGEPDRLFGNDVSRSPAAPVADLVGLDAATRTTARALFADPMRPDDAARALGTDVVTVARALTTLERRGVLARYPDGRYGPVTRR
ncbi:MAG TPA: DNA-protecting protein DprA [Coriobacteriia bacterium]